MGSVRQTHNFVTTTTTLQRMAKGAIASCGYDHGGPSGPSSGDYITATILHVIRNVN
jgi:hypothetical protein